MDCSCPMHRACLTSIYSWRERWTGTYDELVDAAAAAVREPGCTVALADLHRCLDAFSQSCDRAEGLVQAAAAGLGPAASRHDELFHALADLHRCLDAFSKSCDRAEGLVQAAATGLGPATSRHDELFRAVRAVDKDLLAAAAGREENEVEEEKNRPPTTSLAAEDK